ncbi:MAG: MipA/OmpV family protein [Pseudomonadota bacterium]
MVKNTSGRLKLQRMALLVLGAMLPAAGYASHTEVSKEVVEVNQGVSKRVKLPLWELGAGVVGLNLPYYRGSDEEVSYFVPYPYLIYRGARLKVDEVEGARSRVFQSDRTKLDISLAGGVPVPRDAGVRAGMPGLDPTVGWGHPSRSDCGMTGICSAFCGCACRCAPCSLSAVPVSSIRVGARTLRGVDNQ